MSNGGVHDAGEADPSLAKIRHKYYSRLDNREDGKFVSEVLGGLYFFDWQSVRRHCGRHSDQVLIVIIIIIIILIIINVVIIIIINVVVVVVIIMKVMVVTVG